MPGPNRTPTAILAARGSWRANSRPNEPKPAVCVPRCPKGLDDVRKALWKSYGRILAEMGVLTEGDSSALSLLVDADATYRTLEEQVRTQGHTIKGRMQDIVKNPAVAMRDNAWKRLLKILTEFGLSPASRTKVSVNPQAEDSEDSRFFG